MSAVSVLTRQVRHVRHQLSTRVFSSLQFKFGSPVRCVPTAEVPAPKEGELKVAISSAPITFEDIRVVRGLSFIRNTEGFGGFYGVGKVSSIGPDNFKNFNVGDDVLVVSRWGTWNSEIVTTRKHLFPLPSLPMETAALIPDAAAAWAMLHNFVRLEEGDVVVISDHKTVVNEAIKQLGKKMRVKVLVATEADLSGHQFKATAQAAGPVRLAITSQTSKLARAYIHLVQNSGVVVTYNAFIPTLDGISPLELPVSPFIFSNISIRGFDFTTYALTQPRECDAVVGVVADAMMSGDLKLTPKVFAAEKVGEALESAARGEAVVVNL